MRSIVTNVSTMVVAGMIGFGLWNLITKTADLTCTKAKTATIARTTPVEPRPTSDSVQSLEGVMVRARREMASVITETWGEDEVEMPSRRVWLYYDDEMRSRSIFDFERGELRVERLAELGEKQAVVMQSLADSVSQAMRDTAADMAEHDHLMHTARRIAKALGLEVTDTPNVGDGGETPLMKGILPGRVKLTADDIEARWSIGKDDNKRIIMSVRVPFVKGYFAKLAAGYIDTVLEQARAYNIPPSLILAVMQIESAFNPRAYSSAPAYGLMQLVPTSGGLDAYRFVFGESRILDPEYLYQPEKNVRLGSAYLKLLGSRYLRAIKNPRSRLYCTIAAYNTGAGNVARAFTGKTNIKRAAEAINKMAPSEVLDALKKQLPYAETRAYLVKVMAARGNYADLDQVLAGASG